MKYYTDYDPLYFDALYYIHYIGNTLKLPTSLQIDVQAFVEQQNIVLHRWGRTIEDEDTVRSQIALFSSHRSQEALIVFCPAAQK